MNLYGIIQIQIEIENTIISMQENAIDNVFYKSSDILFRPQYV